MNPLRSKDRFANGTWLDHEKWLTRAKVSWMGRCGRARCSDGKIRAVRAHRSIDADRIKAQVRVRGITIQGWVSVHAGSGELRFTPNPDGANAKRLPAYWYDRMASE